MKKQNNIFEIEMVTPNRIGDIESPGLRRCSTYDKNNETRLGKSLKGQKNLTVTNENIIKNSNGHHNKE